MNDDLFRREAIDARNEQWMGSVRLTATPLAWPMAALGMIGVLIAALLLALGSYTRKERVSGRLQPAAGVLAVLAPADGVVSRLQVVEGQTVARDQPLLRIASVQQAAQGPALGAALRTELEQQRRTLQADVRSAAASGLAREAAARERIASLQRQLAIAQQRLRLRREQATSAHDMLQRIQPLQEQRIVSTVQVQEYRSRALDADAQAETAAQDALDAAQQLAQARADLTALRSDNAQAQSQLSRALSEVSQDAARNALQDEVQLRAARAGTVSELATELGQSVSRGQRLLALLPDKSPLRAELWVPSRAIGAVRPGTRVAIRYDAFPHQTYGQGYGHVIALAGSPSPAAEVPLRDGERAAQPAYRVWVAIDQHPRIPAAALRAGMTVQADLLLERRRLYRFVFDPLRGLRDAAAGPSP